MERKSKLNSPYSQDRFDGYPILVICLSDYDHEKVKYFVGFNAAGFPSGKATLLFTGSQ
jgi:hypothetical protein